MGPKEGFEKIFVAFGVYFTVRHKDENKRLKSLRISGI